MYCISILHCKRFFLQSYVRGIRMLHKTNATVLYSNWDTVKKDIMKPWCHQCNRNTETTGFATHRYTKKALRKLNEAGSKVSGCHHIEKGGWIHNLQNETSSSVLRKRLKKKKKKNPESPTAEQNKSQSELSAFWASSPVSKTWPWAENTPLMVSMRGTIQMCMYVVSPNGLPIRAGIQKKLSVSLTSRWWGRW